MYIAKKNLENIILSKFKGQKHLLKDIRKQIKKGKFDKSFLYLFPEHVQSNIKDRYELIDGSEYPFALQQILYEGKTNKLNKTYVETAKYYAEHKLAYFQEYQPMYYLNILWLYVFKGEIFHPVTNTIPGRYVQLIKKGTGFNRVNKKYDIRVFYTTKQLEELIYPLFRCDRNLDILYEYVMNNIFNEDKFIPFRDICDFTYKQFKSHSGVDRDYCELTINWRLLER